MNKTHDELCQEVTMLRDQLEQSQEQGRRLAHRLQETSDMLAKALTLGEDSAERYRALKENRQKEIADAVMRARRDWAAQADPDYLRDRDARVEEMSLCRFAEELFTHSEEETNNEDRAATYREAGELCLKKARKMAGGEARANTMPARRASSAAIPCSGSTSTVAPAPNSARMCRTAPTPNRMPASGSEKHAK